jgi:hypothetical protein
LLSKKYSELVRFHTFDERFDYLKMSGSVGRATFGFDRLVNQRFYKSREWQNVRNEIIIRDNGCDLGVEGYDIFDAPHIHHMNPISLDNIAHHEEWILNPEFLILTTQKTHNAIHYGSDYHLYPKIVVSRKPGDTRLW